MRPSLKATPTLPLIRTLPIRSAQPGEHLVKVVAAGLHPIVKSLANGSHYGSTGQFPFVAGVDGVGRLQDGMSVYFGVARPPSEPSELSLAGTSR